MSHELLVCLLCVYIYICISVYNICVVAIPFLSIVLCQMTFLAALAIPSRGCFLTKHVRWLLEFAGKLVYLDGLCLEFNGCDVPCVRISKTVCLEGSNDIAHKDWINPTLDYEIRNQPLGAATIILYEKHLYKPRRFNTSIFVEAIKPPEKNRYQHLDIMLLENL